jgi:hypothetical protein
MLATAEIDADAFFRKRKIASATEDNYPFDC